MRYLLIFLFAFLLLFVSASGVFAKTIELSPAFVDIVLERPGDEKSFNLFITNKTEKPIKVDFSSLDFKQTDPYGAIGFLGKDIGNYTYSLSSFLSFDNSFLEINSGERKKLIVTVRNREDLSPGGHYAAVIVRQVQAADRENTLISPALSSLIYLNKRGGERYNLSFKDINFPKLPVVFSYPGTYFITFQNDGNVHLIPYGRAEIKDFLGRTIRKGIINEGSFRILPSSRRFIPVYSKKISYSLPISINKLTVEGKDSLGKTNFFYEEVFIYLSPWFLVGAPALLVILAWILRRRKND